MHEPQRITRDAPEITHHTPDIMRDAPDMTHDAPSTTRDAADIMNDVPAIAHDTAGIMIDAARMSSCRQRITGDRCRMMRYTYYGFVNAVPEVVSAQLKERLELPSRGGTVSPRAMAKQMREAPLHCFSHCASSRDGRTQEKEMDRFAIREPVALGDRDPLGVLYSAPSLNYSARAR